MLGCLCCRLFFNAFESKSGSNGFRIPVRLLSVRDDLYFDGLPKFAYFLACCWGFVKIMRGMMISVTGTEWNIGFYFDFGFGFLQILAFLVLVSMLVSIIKVKKSWKSLTLRHFISYISLRRNWPTQLLLKARKREKLNFAMIVTYQK